MFERSLIIDKEMGVTSNSLKTLERILKIVSEDYFKGQPVKIYEFRNEIQFERAESQEFFCPDARDMVEIGFYIKSPSVSGLGGPSFWIPLGKDYMNLTDKDGGEGTSGYETAIALIYKYLNHHPRIIVDPQKRKDFTFINDFRALDEFMDSLEVKEVVEEPFSVQNKLMNDLGFGNFSFVVLDIETTRNLKSPKYILGSTWDFYNGMKVWEEAPVVDLLEYCYQYDKIVTYNGEAFDFKVLSPYGPQAIEVILRDKSADLYKSIKKSVASERKYTRKGELTLANVAFATLGSCKWECYYRPDLERRREPLDDGLIDHCIRDVEMTRDLFFYILENHHLYHISRNEMEEGRLLKRIPLGGFMKSLNL
jgi:hypothetical protein